MSHNTVRPNFVDCTGDAGCPCSGCAALRSHLEWSEQALAGATCAFCLPADTAKVLPAAALMIKHMDECELHPYKHLADRFHTLTASRDAAMAERDALADQVRQLHRVDAMGIAARNSLRARVKELEEALRFYADPRSYGNEPFCLDDMGNIGNGTFAPGATARAVLARQDGKETL